MALLSIFLIASASANDLNTTADMLNLEDNTDELISLDDDADEMRVNEENEIIGTDYTPLNFSDIQKKIDGAKDNDNIVLDGTYIMDSSDVEITVNKQLNFIGINDATIIGNSKARLLTVNSNGVLFKNITFKDNHASESGSVIYSYNINFMVENCRFVNNTASYYGALIGGTAVNCSFINNSATYGGATYGTNAFNCIFRDNSASAGGAMDVGYAVNCSFINNSAYSGGAMYCARAVNCTFIDNSAIRYGGAVFNCNATNCSFINNSAEFAGAIYFDTKKGIAMNCRFVGNSGNIFSSAVYNCDVYNCSFSDNYKRDVLYLGNAFNCSFVNNFYTVITNGNAFNCSFINNSVSEAVISRGNAQNCLFIDNYNGYYGVLCEVNAMNCTFINNRFRAMYSGVAENCTFINNTADNGGAMYSAAAINCTFINNTATESGGAIYYGNVANAGSCIDCTFINNNAKQSGGAIYNYDAVNCNFIGNYANDGGALYKGSALDCSFENNRASGNGGAMFGDTYNATNCQFISNIAKNGGALYQIMAFNCNFTGNNASLNGGAMYEKVSSNCKYYYNHADCDGGAVYDVIVSRGLFEHNSAGNNGGAMYGNRVSESTFNENSAESCGGAVCSARISTNSQFDNNHANDGEDYYDVEFFEMEKSLDDLNELINNNTLSDIYINENYTFDFAEDNDFIDGIVIDRPLTIHGNGYTLNGGGFARIFNITGSNVVIKDLSFVNCYSKSDGGAIFGECKVIDSSFISNSASSGGVLYGGSAWNCTFINNLANGYYARGGVLYGGSAWNCTFINNTAKNRGGAIYGSNGGNVVNCTFINNSAEDYAGGAIYWEFGLEILDSIFINNYASGGGAVYVRDAVIVNCSFYNNSAFSAGALYDEGYCINCSFVGNSATYGGGAASYVTAVNCTFINNSDNQIGGGAIDAGEAYGCTFIGNKYNVVYDCVVADCKFINNSGRAMKGGSAVNCTFIDNFDYYYSYIDGSAISTCDAFNCTFINNSPSSGNAVYNSKVVNCTFIDHKSSVLYKSNAVNCTFINNTVSSKGVIEMSIAINCTFVNNVAIRDNDGAAAWQSDVSDCIFISNSASGRGGAMYLGTAANSYFFNNSAANGGAVYGTSVVNCTFVNNSATNKGGAIYVSGNQNITNCSFTNCTAKNQGNAIYWSGCNVTVSLSNFTGCGLNCLEFNNPSTYEIIDCLFDIAPQGVDYYYNSYLDVDDLYISVGEYGYITTNLVNFMGPLHNKKIIFAFNGDSYDEYTNADGLIEFNIINYISGSGETNVSVIFEGDGHNKPISKNITVYRYQFNGILTGTVDGKYYNDTILTFNLVNSKNNRPIANVPLGLTFSNGVIVNLTTDSKGVASYRIPFAPRTYSVSANVVGEHVNVNTVDLNNIVINKIMGDLVINASGKLLEVKAYNPYNLDVFRNIDINLEFDNGVVAVITTNDYGIASYYMNFTKGIYNVYASVEGDFKEFDDNNLDNIVINNDFTAEITFSNDIVFNFQEFGSANVTIIGGVIGNMTILNHPEALISYAGNVLSVFNLGVGNYTLVVDVIPDGYHDSVSGNVSVVVNPAKSRVTFKTGVVFEYGSSTSIIVTVEGGVVKKDSICIVDHPEAVISFNNDVITLSGLAAGKYTLSVETTPDSNHYSVNSTVGITVTKAVAFIKSSSLSVYSKSGKKWSVTLTNSKTKAPLAGMEVVAKFTVNGKTKTYKATTNSKGIATFDVSKWDVGNHKVTLSFTKAGYACNPVTTSVNVMKTTKLSFKSKSKAEKAGSRIYVWTKEGKKFKNGIKLYLYVYSGKKAQKFTVITGKFKDKSGKVNKGFVGYATNILSPGKHKIVIKPASDKYSGSKKAKIVIKKSAKKFKKTYSLISKGKNSVYLK